MTIRNLRVGENCYECLQIGAHEINCFPCFPSNEKKILMKKRSTKCKERAGVTSLFRNMSFESLDSQQTNLAEEIIKLGSRNISSNIFTYQELSAVTKDFTTECLVGEGGFGKVYKGKLSNTNQVVAIKRLDRNGFQGNREFLMEILMLSLYHHPNLISLIGYCAEKDQRILVYEYMPMGSLEDHLFDICNNKKPLDWKTRMRIAKGAAKGLEYLHNSPSPSVIYRDFKPSNILLDEDFNPKLSDFGLAKLGPTGDKSHVSTRVMGTYGYCAPEYVLTSQLSIKSDVYSFGAVFLEIITGKRVIDSARPTSEQNLVSWVQPIFRDRSKFESIVDPLLEGKYPIKDLYQALAVADMCLQEVASTRPFISDVVSALEYLSEPEQGSKDAMNSGYCHEVSEAGVRSHGIEEL